MIETLYTYFITQGDVERTVQLVLLLLSLAFISSSTIVQIHYSNKVTIGSGFLVCLTLWFHAWVLSDFVGGVAPIAPEVWPFTGLAFGASLFSWAAMESYDSFTTAYRPYDKVDL